ncbi:UvrD-helicase domain-containing protein [Roseimaritima sediminicola]|uniref:UvrD-helicase domain-containing protein n=1 Tax=Roseimaritima sediminicola TaxID=2662066 RepID=UPI001386C1A6|nr:UvrD-helicase domain-containing protein [Roseimaritima sediminicola]
MFLHPSQRGFVDRRFNGPTRVSGSAGTGKTIVAIHRAVAALTAAQGRVLLTTFSDELAKSLRKKTQLLIPADRLTDRLPEFDSPSTLVVASLEGIATQLMTREAGQQRTVTDAELLEMIETIANEDKSVSLSSRFLLDE